MQRGKDQPRRYQNTELFHACASILFIALVAVKGNASLFQFSEKNNGYKEATYGEQYLLRTV